MQGSKIFCTTECKNLERKAGKNREQIAFGGLLQQFG